MKSILIVENHPLVSESYMNSINSLSHGKVINIDVVRNCKDAEEYISKTHSKNKIDAVVVGLCIPYSDGKKELYGENLCEKIRETYPSIKIIIATRVDCPYRIVSVVKKIDPDVFLLKKDLTQSEFKEALNNMISDFPYYSKSVMKVLRKEISSGFMLDNIDRQLLYELSIGTKMKVLPNIIPLSMRGIEKRKKQLKDLFNVKVTDDRGLVIKAKEVGLV